LLEVLFIVPTKADPGQGQSLLESQTWKEDAKLEASRESFKIITNDSDISNQVRPKSKKESRKKDVLY